METANGSGRSEGWLSNEWHSSSALCYDIVSVQSHCMLRLKPSRGWSWVLRWCAQKTIKGKLNVTFDLDLHVLNSHLSNTYWIVDHCRHIQKEFGSYFSRDAWNLWRATWTKHSFGIKSHGNRKICGHNSITCASGKYCGSIGTWSLLVDHFNLAWQRCFQFFAIFELVLVLNWIGKKLKYSQHICASKVNGRVQFIRTKELLWC